jgi:hypothetical protein
MMKERERETSDDAKREIRGGKETDLLSSLMHER